MFQLLWDGRPYQTYATRELAEVAGVTLKRWAGLGTRFEVVPVEPAPPACRGCNGSGIATRLVWKRGWVWGDGPCRSCGGSGAVPAPSVPAAA